MSKDLGLVGENGNNLEPVQGSIFELPKSQSLGQAPEQVERKEPGLLKR